MLGTFPYVEEQVLYTCDECPSATMCIDNVFTQSFHVRMTYVTYGLSIKTAYKVYILYILYAILTWKDPYYTYTVWKDCTVVNPHMHT